MKYLLITLFISICGFSQITPIMSEDEEIAEFRNFFELDTKADEGHFDSIQFAKILRNEFSIINKFSIVRKEVYERKNMYYQARMSATLYNGKDNIRVNIYVFPNGKAAKKDFEESVLETSHYQRTIKEHKKKLYNGNYIFFTTHKFIFVHKNITTRFDYYEYKDEEMRDYVKEGTNDFSKLLIEMAQEIHDVINQKSKFKQDPKYVERLTKQYNTIVQKKDEERKAKNAKMDAERRAKYIEEQAKEIEELRKKPAVPTSFLEENRSTIEVIAKKYFPQVSEKQEENLHANKITLETLEKIFEKKGNSLIRYPNCFVQKYTKNNKHFTIGIYYGLSELDAMHGLCYLRIMYSRKFILEKKEDPNEAIQQAKTLQKRTLKIGDQCFSGSGILQTDFKPYGNSRESELYFLIGNTVVMIVGDEKNTSMIHIAKQLEKILRNTSN